MKKIMLVLLFVCSSVAIAQELPSVGDLGVDQKLGEIETSVDNLPDTLDPDLTPDETATQLFSYMKWLFQPSSASELLGETLAPIGLELYALVLLALTYVILWLTIRALVLTWRFFLFIVSWVIKLIELIPVFQ